MFMTNSVDSELINKSCIMLYEYEIDLFIVFNCSKLIENS